MKQRIVIAGTLAFFLLGLSCTSSSGTLYRSVVDNGPQTESEEQDQEEPGSIYVESDPEGAAVYLNNRYQGQTPLEIQDIKAGGYQLTVEKEGYLPQSRWIQFSDKGEQRYYFKLEPIIGYLDLKVIPSHALIYIDSKQTQAGLQALTIGRHLLEIRAFSYQTENRTVFIEENSTTTLTVELAEAEFSVSDLEISRPRFNPLNPGPLGKTKISFEVSSFGKGELNIYDSAGMKVWGHIFPPFTTWHQELYWRGLDSAGKPLPDGEYRVELQTHTAESSETQFLSSSVSIDQQAFINFRSLWSGSPGLLYSTTADLLAPDAYQLAFLTLGHWNLTDGGFFPSQFSSRIGLFDGMELFLQATAMIKSTGATPFSFTLGAKTQVIPYRTPIGVSAALSAKISYQYGTSVDTMTNFSGLSAGLPVQFNLGVFHWVLMPELILSPYRVSYSAYDQQLHFSTWAYGRSGFYLDYGWLITGVSAAVRTTPLNEGLSLDFPLAGGWEAHYFIPNTQILFSAALALEWHPDPLIGWYLLGGLGLGLLN